MKATHAAVIDAVRAHPRAGDVPDTLCQPVGDLVTEMLAWADPDGNATISEAIALMEAVRDPDARQREISIAGRRMHLGMSTLWIDGKSRSYSCRVPGFHSHLPDDAGLPDRIVGCLTRRLASIGYDGPGIEGMRIYRRSDGGTTVGLILDAHEHHGAVQRYDMMSVNRPISDWTHSVDRIATAIRRRWSERTEIGRRIADLKDRVVRYVAGVEGLKILDIETRTVDYENDERVKYVAVDVRLEGIGNELAAQTFETTVSDTTDGDGMGHLRTIAGRHRKALKALSETDGGHSICCVLAAAIRTMPRDFRTGLLAELEGLIAGTRSNPTNPRRRGISNLAIDAGLVTASVTLGRTVRYEKGRIVVKNDALTDTMKNGILGQAVNEVVAHPFLTDAPIVSCSNNSRGIYIRPERRSEPLAPILALLRS